MCHIIYFKSLIKEGNFQCFINGSFRENNKVDKDCPSLGLQTAHLLRMLTSRTTDFVLFS